MSQRLNKERLYMYSKLFVNIYEYKYDSNQLKDTSNLEQEEIVNIISLILFFLADVVKKNVKVIYDKEDFLVLFKDENVAKRLLKVYGKEKIFLYPYEIKITHQKLKEKSEKVYF